MAGQLTDLATLGLVSDDETVDRFDGDRICE
jgi:hypothetical protein